MLISPDGVNQLEPRLLCYFCTLVGIESMAPREP